jgi:nucleoside-diphosphate-sugar epimerase
MPSVLIFGGSGKLATFITERLIKKQFTVYSIIRRQEHIHTLQELGAIPIIQSLEESSVAELASVIKSKTPDAIIFAAGAGLRAFEDPSLSETIDRDGAIKVFDAMAEAGCTKRLIMISTIDARDRSKAAPTWYNDEDKETSAQLWGMLPKYMEAKFAADKSLVEGNARRGLDYTIVRPTWYDNEGKWTGKVEAGKVGTAPKVSREDIADVFVSCVEDSGTIGTVFEVKGGNVPVGDAVRRVAAEKIDVFAGLH